MICIYEADCKDFSGNGLGVVTPQSCTVTETLNGEWELTLVHPIDEDGKWMRLTEGRILRAPVPAAMTPQVDLVIQQYQTTTYDVLIYRVNTSKDPLRLRSGTGTNYRILSKYKKGTEVIVLNKTSDSWYEVTCPDGKHGYMSAQYLEYVRTETQSTQSYAGFQNQTIEPRQLRDQPFRIYRVVPELSQVTIYARHVFYDLMDNMVKKVEAGIDEVGASVVRKLSASCLSQHDFTFYSDLQSTSEDALWENVNPVEAMLGSEGLTAKYQAELARDWFDVFLVKRVGVDSQAQIREKKNLTGISYDVDETGVVTRIMPTGEDKDGNLLYLPELYLDSPNLAAYPHVKWVHLPVSEAKESDSEDSPKSIQQCYEEMRKAAQAQFEAGCDLPTVTLAVDFINCADTAEYAQYHALTNIYLGDAVRVIAPRIGVEVSMRMTQYTYDCLTRKYTAITLGTVAGTPDTATITSGQLVSGSITGAKLALNSVGTGALQNGAVGSLQIKNAAIQSAHIQDAAITSAHIQEASITRAHIAEALINVLNVNALTAVSAKIKELAAEHITTDELYASIAQIAYAQLTTANIIEANIEWADIENLAANIAEISKAQINTANILEANIDWAAITTLSAAVASMVKADIGSADIDFAHIKDMVTDTAIITKGVGGKLYIADLAVTEANMASLTVGELVVKGEDGHFYALSVDDEGHVTTTLKQISNDDVEDVSINAGEKIIEGTITAGTLNVQNIFADNETIRELIAANINVDTLFARQATIDALNATDITSNTYLRLMVSGKADQADVDGLTERMDEAELKITEDAIVSTVTGSPKYQRDREEILEKLNSGQITASNTAPENPTVDRLWLDTSDEPNMLKRWDGKSWVECGADVDLSDYYTRTEMDTRFRQTEEAIELKADKSVTDDLTGRVETAETTLKTQADEIAATTSKANSAYNTLSSLNIGGRNYFLGSQRTLELNSTEDTNVWLNPPLTLSDDFLPDSKSRQVAISVWVMTENLVKASNAWIGIQITLTLTTGAKSSIMLALATRITSATQSWTRYSSYLNCPFNAESVDSVMMTIQHCSGRICLKNPQIEVGNRVTAYSPAPEDLQIARQTTPPAEPGMDMLWLDTSVVPNLLKRWNGSEWAVVNDTSALAERMESAELKLKPDALMTSVRSSALYRYDRYGGRNYLLLSGSTHTFVNGYYQRNGSSTTATGYQLSVSPDFYEHSGKLAYFRFAFDIKRTNVDASTASTPGTYFGLWVYYRYYADDGVTINTAGRGVYLYTSDADFHATDSDWVRLQKGAYNFSQYKPIEVAYFMLGTSAARGMTGTVQIRNIKLEVGDSYTAWSAAPEDLNNLPTRMTTAESSIAQHSNQLALTVSSSTYEAEKITQSPNMPLLADVGKLWLDTFLSPPILKRWTGSEWVAVAAEEVKTSGIYIGSNNVKITTENFLLQLLDPANNENVLMEMAANGYVGFKQLYADEVISDSVAQAYAGPTYIYIQPSYSGMSDTYYRSLGEAVKAVNFRYLKNDVYIYMMSSGELYEYGGVQIQGVTGPGRLTISSAANCKLNSYVVVKGCTANITFSNLNLREIRPLNGSSRNSYLIEIQTSHYVELSGCTLDANNTTYDSVYCRASHVSLINTGLYNALQGLEVYMGTAVVKSCKGSCSWSMIAYSGYIIATGTVPAGSRSTGENGQLFANGVTVDYGTAIPAVTPTDTTIQYASPTRTWQGSWRTDTLDVVQGLYSDGGYSSSINWNRGCMWFPNLRNVLYGMTIKSATLTLYRKKGGASGARTVYLCAISNTGPSGTPSIAANYGAIGMIGRETQVTFAIPNAAVEGLANGIYGGLCLFEPMYNFGSSQYSYDYMRMGGTDSSYQPYLRVVYTGSEAVG